MAADQEVTVLARLTGARQFMLDAEGMSASLRKMGVQSEFVGSSFERTSRRGLLMNQALFTVRRLLYGTTLAFLGLGVAAVRMGFNFNSSMQQARIALAPVSAQLGGVNKELNYLFNFTKYTPFQFKDVTIAFRTMYGSMSLLGISAHTVNTTIKSLTDALAYAGKTSPMALTRVSVALQHMAYQGHLTGYSVNQLARDGIPIFAALHKELGLTGEQIHNIGQLGIPTAAVLKAINSYIETTPLYANAAYRQATGSLSGLFTTFKDNISQLMGNMETGVFAHFQRRLVEFNAFFGRISSSMQHHASFQSVIGQAFGTGAVLMWHQFSADLSLVWHIFSGLISDVVRSHAVWATLYAALLLLHGILLPINFAVQNMSGLLYVLIPLWVAYRTAIILDTGALVINRWVTIATTKSVKEMTFAQWLFSLATKAGITAMIIERAQMIWLGIQMALFSDESKLMIGLQWLWTGALYAGYTAMGLFGGAMTILGNAAVWLRTQMALLTIVMELNPIILIATAVIALTAGLVILYLKWKAFHDAVNTTVRFLWNHPLVTMILPIIGPLIVMAKLIYEIYTHLNAIKNLAEHPIRSIQHGLRSSWFHSAAHWAGAALGLMLPFGGGGLLPGLAGGGTALSGGYAVVGENGPEIVRLPQAASVIPLNRAREAVGGGGRTVQPLIVQLVVNERILGEIITEVQTDGTARL